MVRPLPLQGVEAGITGTVKSPNPRTLEMLPKSTIGKGLNGGKTMRYMILANLGIILSVVAILGKSVWGKSVW